MGVTVKSWELIRIIPNIAMDTLLLKSSIEQLQDVAGGGTSMISLIISPKDTISSANRLLIDEHGAASNIKSRVNRQSVQWAITSAQQKLKLFAAVPKNGLAIYCGEIHDGKPIPIAFEPPTPLNTFKYLCDNHFFTEPLEKMLIHSKTYGFIIADGNGFNIYCKIQSPRLSPNPRGNNTLLHHFEPSLHFFGIRFKASLIK